MPTRAPTPIRTDITLSIYTNRELTADDVRMLGRDAASRILDNNGTSSSNYSDFSRRFVQAIRFNEFEWQSDSENNPEYRREWRVTEAEQQDWDEEHEYDDDF